MIKKLIIISLFTVLAVTSTWFVREYMTRDVFVSEFGYFFKKPQGYAIKDIIVQNSIKQSTHVYLVNKNSEPFISISGPMIGIGIEQLEKLRQGRGYYKSGQDASSYVYLDDWKFPPALVETSEGLFIVDFESYEDSGVRNAVFNEHHLAAMRLIISTLDVKKGTRDASMKKDTSDPNVSILFDPLYEGWGRGAYSYNLGLSAPEARGDIYEDELRGPEL